MNTVGVLQLPNFRRKLKRNQQESRAIARRPRDAAAVASLKIAGIYHKCMNLRFRALESGHTGAKMEFNVKWPFKLILVMFLGTMEN